MGYSTNFEGALTLTPAATAAQVAYIKAFARTRRMIRDESQTAGRPDPIRELVELPVGKQGEYFVGSTDPFGQEWNAQDVIDTNRPPDTQPGLWCKWILTEDGTKLEWSGAEKFYDYVEWLQYLINNFFEPWGVKLSGEISWVGEDSNDKGKIIVSNNEISVLRGKTVYA